MTNVDIQAGRYEGLQAVWGWKVAVYLFLAGAGSGAFTVGRQRIFWGGTGG